ncbi:MAG TPA: flagellar export chaperone FliS [Acidimicrobiales bacterium]|nr:flagellar export chaperone FliS [Acidimicrobiales bacterium]
MERSATEVAAAYAGTSASTLSGPQLLLKLYERLVSDMGEARAAIVGGQVREAHEALVHAQRIVQVLAAALQPDRFPAGRDLLALYQVLEAALAQANLEKRVEALDICVAIVEPLQRAWEQAVPAALGESELAGAGSVLA